MLNANDVKAMMIAVSDEIIRNEDVLSEADRQLGDGDHGLGMTRGFTAAKAQLEALAPTSVSQVFTTLGMALMSTMGGASGAVFGMLFQSGGMAIASAEGLDAPSLSSFLDAGTQGVMNIGKAKPGDKTMVDALVAAQEAVAAAKDGSIEEALAAAAEGARAGMEKTKDMIAQLGRARTLGEKTLGHPDAGAISVSIIFKTASDFAAKS
ncbi:MAG: dihydroxyacetone kinase subunit DhaL [Verrucomicrobia bacterium]|nr:dihydroxyacetone kinase subunit DhaL [Verrucomicrobiota bacterium]MDA1068737.1 dihydroxyacetone kinase subunit DhaL [Verrucomicrobiota bacterium]